MTVRAIIAGGERFSVGGGADGGRAAIALDDHEIDPARRPVLRETLLVGLLCTRPLRARTPQATGWRSRCCRSRGGGHVAGGPGAASPVAGDRAVPHGAALQATIHHASEVDGGLLVLVKVAPERVAAMCDTRRTADGREEPLPVEDVVDDSETLAADGLRVLAMAMGRGEAAAAAAADGRAGGLTFVGMQGLLDAPRQTAVDAVDRCHDAGIRVVMVTGDHATAAAAIGRQVHLDRPVCGRHSEPAGARRMQGRTWRCAAVRTSRRSTTTGSIMSWAV